MLRIEGGAGAIQAYDSFLDRRIQAGFGGGDQVDLMAGAIPGCVAIAGRASADFGRPERKRHFAKHLDLEYAVQDTSTEDDGFTWAKSVYSSSEPLLF